ncbi:D-isomer specific 2-hydroxyacid dehydrogenase family protein [Microcella alkalica]|uniref:Phosphoglycerate dehydrogenase-like enzyme n=1 Tax=Microcella alkalica TaxID=355930 RepID=A0A839E580_9MICO|nr:D-isomer specific 2-hydroxyacid dehydrogenase family protein [Microcella alkalica]MBA8846950.1 phosphoglycerate dehydrogenase-like enzyme [Microcella alkalica]
MTAPPSDPDPRPLAPLASVTRVGPTQHEDPLAGRSAAPPTGRRIAPGPIAVLPRPTALFVDAARAGGAEVVEISAATRGLIWLSEQRAEELAELLDAHPGIQWVQLPWAGVDGFSSILPRYADGRGPLFTSAKGAYSEPVAEHAVALLHAVLRELAPKVRAARWAPVRTGLSLYGRHVVIVGAGGIAAEIIRLLTPWRVRITVVRRSPGDVPGAHRTVTVDELHGVLPEADALILAAASTERTRHLIGSAELALLPEHAALVNIARGALIDTGALVEALREKRILGAGLDVTDPEPLGDDHALWSEPRCIITSHSADTPEMTAPLLAGRITENVRGFLGDGRFVGIVDPAAGY